MGNGHVRIVFHVKTLFHQISMIFYNTNSGEGVNTMFQLLFWRKHRHSGAYIKLLEAPHCLKKCGENTQL